ncbi:MAG: hypothetical protein K6E63_00380 [Lachnospiraceae bacterium]|nr:hypothetical protein [Lachnospiraceae bacterium]
MKKTGVLICAVLMLSVLAACGSKDSDSDEPVRIVATPNKDKEDKADKAESISFDEDDGEEQEESGLFAEPEEKEDKEKDKASDGAYKEAYRALVSEFYNGHKDEESEYSSLGFDLIYFDDDDIPELVTGLNGYYVNLYSFDGTKAFPIIEEWGYGAGGNAGYEYLPKEGMIFNSNADYAGAWMWLSYMKWDPEKREMVDLNPDGLCIRYVEDEDGDGMLSDAEMEKYSEDDEKYYYGDKQITKAEFDSMCHDGNYEELYGSKSYDEINAQLKDS